MSVHSRPARDDVRSAVVRAAGDLFIRRGYAVTTLGEIAQEAGFTKGAIYSNFGGKPELFAAAMADRLSERTSSAIQAAALLGGGQSGALVRQLAELVVSESWSLLMNEFRVVASRDPAAAAVYARLRSQAQSDLAARLRADDATLHLGADVDHDGVAVLLITVITGLAVEHALAPEVTSVAVIESALGQLLRGVQP